MKPLESMCTIVLELEGAFVDQTVLVDSGSFRYNFVDLAEIERLNLGASVIYSESIEHATGGDTDFETDSKIQLALGFGRTVQNVWFWVAKNPVPWVLGMDWMRRNSFFLVGIDGVCFPLGRYVKPFHYIAWTRLIPRRLLLC